MADGAGHGDDIAAVGQAPPYARFPQVYVGWVSTHHSIVSARGRFTFYTFCRR